MMRKQERVLKEKMNKNKRYMIMKSLDYYFVDRKMDEKIPFYKHDSKWKHALNEMSQYIRDKRISLKEIYFAPSISKCEKGSLLEKICKN